MDINKNIARDALSLYVGDLRLKDVRTELAEMIADAINDECPGDDTCPCWLAGYEKGIKTPREPHGY